MVVEAKLGSAQAMPETKLGCLALRADKESRKKKKSIVSKKHRPGEHLNLSKSAEEKGRTGDCRKMVENLQKV